MAHLNYCFFIYFFKKDSPQLLEISKQSLAVLRSYFINKIESFDFFHIPC